MHTPPNALILMRTMHKVPFHGLITSHLPITITKVNCLRGSSDYRHWPKAAVTFLDDLLVTK